jgi:hypothetical protein
MMTMVFRVMFANFASFLIDKLQPGRGVKTGADQQAANGQGDNTLQQYRVVDTAIRLYTTF